MVLYLRSWFSFELRHDLQPPRRRVHNNNRNVGLFHCFAGLLCGYRSVAHDVIHVKHIKCLSKTRSSTLTRTYLNPYALKDELNEDFILFSCIESHPLQIARDRHRDNINITCGIYVFINPTTFQAIAILRLNPPGQINQLTTNNDFILSITPVLHYDHRSLVAGWFVVVLLFKLLLVDANNSQIFKFYVREATIIEHNHRNNKR